MRTRSTDRRDFEPLGRYPDARDPMREALGLPPNGYGTHPLGFSSRRFPGPCHSPWHSCRASLRATCPCVCTPALGLDALSAGRCFQGQRKGVAGTQAFRRCWNVAVDGTSASARMFHGTSRSLAVRPAMASSQVVWRTAGSTWQRALHRSRRLRGCASSARPFVWIRPGEVGLARYRERRRL